MSFLAQLRQTTMLWPEGLWLLAVLPVLVAMYVWFGRRHERVQARLAGLWQSDRSVRSAFRRALPPFLFLLGLAALLGAVARPQAVLTLPSVHKNVMLAIDTSGSMRATDVKPSRLAAAQNAARIFVERLPPHTRVGIVSVAGAAAVVQSPTDNRNDLMQAIERLNVQRGTALGSGIYVALATLLPEAGINLEHLVHGRPDYWSRWPGAEVPGKGEEPFPGSNKSVAIVVISDGESNHGPDPLEAAKVAAKHGVRIYTVGIGSTEGIPVGFSGWSVRVRLDEETLRQIATTTLGEYYVATSAQELNKIHEHLNARMVIERTRTVEATAFLVGAGAALLLISTFCSVLWFNRVV